METTVDILVVGGGLGGVAAALAALEEGRSVLLTEDASWLGGQLTTQAVPPDEHPWIERSGGSARYRTFRRAVRRHYRQWYPLTEQARRRTYLNPGGSWVSALAHEPMVARMVIESMMLPHRSAGRLRVLLRTRLESVDVDHDRITSATVVGRDDGETTIVHASIVVDATETGKLLEASGTEFVTGKESQRSTGEPHASDEPAPLDMQAFTICVAVDHVPGGDHVIERPRGYERWRTHTLPGWPGPQLSWSALDPRTLEPVTYAFDPDSRDSRDDRSHVRGKGPKAKDLWSYRRIIARRNFRDGAYEGDISILNWPQNDYTGGPLYGVPLDVAAGHLDSARELSRSLMYWLQTEAPRPDGGQGWPGIRARGDIVGTTDGLAPRAYVRESRRIVAEYTITETDVALAERGGRGAERYSDSVGTGYYRIDLHPTTGGATFLDIPTSPFELPLGALLPIRMENLLPGAKNIGTTHITNGCYRLHPMEWLIGEVAGRLAAYATAERLPPRAVRADQRHLERFQASLLSRGIDLRWPDGLRAPADR